MTDALKIEIERLSREYRDAARAMLAALEAIADLSATGDDWSSTILLHATDAIAKAKAAGISTEG
jgi:hypothetical protein